jgi:hypothetical protein
MLGLEYFLSHFDVVLCNFFVVIVLDRVHAYCIT